MYSRALSDHFLLRLQFSTVEGVADFPNVVRNLNEMKKNNMIDRELKVTVIVVPG